MPPLARSCDARAREAACREERGRWLVESDHVTWILASDWSRSRQGSIGWRERRSGGCLMSGRRCLTQLWVWRETVSSDHNDDRGSKYSKTISPTSRLSSILMPHTSPGDRDLSRHLTNQRAGLGTIDQWGGRTLLGTSTRAICNSGGVRSCVWSCHHPSQPSTGLPYFVWLTKDV